MTRLILMRHAKSSSSDPSLPDHDRPLNQRGRHAAQQMADELVRRGYVPDAIICSTALRARQTLAPLLQMLNGSVHLTMSRALYEAQSEHYPGLIMAAGASAGQPDTTPGTLMLIGHNFAIQDVALALAGNCDTPQYKNLKSKFPTGAAAVLDFARGLANCTPGSGTLSAFLRPRDL
uniref:SixA phosphatase family protein n=1 Tax=Pararhizobium sp. IMCC3301 TaxID=3067904 RepID=UPI002741574D|nr:histidine phosphatase family protein [Pararhizobium sp. IMCC3301]